MSRPSHQSQSGFTVIETLIVMAIGGLIFLIIFNAIPALVRNGHNNQRKQDATSILNAISHYQLNNTGSVPPDAGFLSAYNVKLSFYEDSDVTVHTQAAPSLSPVGITGDGIDIYNYHLCDADTGGATAIGAGFRDVVALYNVETGGGLAPRCQQL